MYIRCEVYYLSFLGYYHCYDL